MSRELDQRLLSLRHMLPILGLRSKLQRLRLRAVIQKWVIPRAAPGSFHFPRPPTKGIPPMTEEEAQEKRRRYLKTIGAVLKNLENRMEAR